MLQLLLLGLGLISLVWNLIALVLYPLLPRALGLRVGRAGIAWGYRLFWAVARASGLLHMDADALRPLADERGLVIVANHPSLLDALMLVAQLPRSACVMKASLMRNPLLGAGARLARYIRNDSPRQMVHLAVDDLRAGGQLVMFPEGTRTTRAPLNPFQARLRADRAARRRAGADGVHRHHVALSRQGLAAVAAAAACPSSSRCAWGGASSPGPISRRSVQEIERYMAAGVRPVSRPTES